MTATYVRMHIHRVYIVTIDPSFRASHQLTWQLITPDNTISCCSV